MRHGNYRLRRVSWVFRWFRQFRWLAGPQPRSLKERSLGAVVFCLASARAILGVALVLLISASACTDSGKKSAEFARGHVKELVATAREDVRQVRTGLPLGAVELAKHLPPDGEIPAAIAREALEKARNKVADLRVAKSTFFAVVLPDGVVARNDREQDRMVGKNLLGSFPGLRPALESGYVETRGSMPEGAEVRGRPDPKGVAAAR